MATKRQIPKWFTTNITEEVSDSTIFKFTVRINGKDIEVDMRADLEVDYSIILQQLEDTPSELAYWAAIYSELKARCSLLERKIKARRGFVSVDIIDKYSKQQTKLTDKQLLSAIDGDIILNGLETELTKIQKHTGKLYFMIEAIKMKSDNLRSLAGFARIEAEHSQRS